MLALIILLGIFIALIGLALGAFWIWMLVDSITNKKLPEAQRAIWALVIIVVGLVGALIYFFVGRSPNVSVAPAYSPPSANRQPRREAPPVEEDYRPYAEGYAPQHEAHSGTQHILSTEPSLEQTQSEQSVQYEQISISYPEQ
jgi:flagellar basal body-associated protein FliL